MNCAGTGIFTSPVPSLHIHNVCCFLFSFVGAFFLFWREKKHENSGCIILGAGENIGEITCFP